MVVAGIASILMALLLSAVQNARSSAVRTECGERLRQLALAIHNYRADRKAMPPGVSWQVDGGAYPFLSWHARILPYIGQSAMWHTTDAAFKIDPFFARVPPHTNLGEAVAAFACPADTRAQRPRFCATRNRVVGLTSYLGVQGSNFATRDGVLYVDSATRIGDIRDGASNTILLGERPPSADNRFGWWYAGIGQRSTGSGDMVLGAQEMLGTNEPCEFGPHSFRPGRDGDVCDFLHFWSHHSGGAHFAFADGSVRFLAYSADAILPALATRAGGETVTTP